MSDSKIVEHCQNCFYYDNGYCKYLLNEQGEFYEVLRDSWCPEYHFDSNKGE